MRLANFFFITFILSRAALAAEKPPWSDVYCTIRDNGASLACQNNTGSDTHTMSANDIASFVDQAEVGTHVIVKSKKKYERVFMVDPGAAQFKRLQEIKKNASVSELSRAKNELFLEIEKKLIKLSDDLDSAAASAELVKYDPSIGADKYRREIRDMTAELDGFKKNKEKVCTATPAFENLSKTNASLQKTLSGILVAFNTPGTCMYDYKVFKDRDGAVDLRQLDEVGGKYRESCKK